MISKWRYIFWPFAFLNFLKEKVRDRFFEIGVWKSVEFEIPVITVGSLTREGEIGISSCIRQITDGVIHVDRFDMTKFDLKKDESRSFNYCAPLNQSNMFTTRHLVLGLSEWFHHNSHTKAFILNDQFRQNEVRPKMKVLLTDYERPFYEDELFPVGELRDSKVSAQRADVIIVFQTPDNIDIRKMESNLHTILKSEVPIFFIKNSKESLKSFNSSDQIEFISDRDNFERLILKVLPNANPDSE